MRRNRSLVSLSDVRNGLDIKVAEHDKGRYSDLVESRFGGRLLDLVIVGHEPLGLVKQYHRRVVVRTRLTGFVEGHRSPQTQHLNRKAGRVTTLGPRAGWAYPMQEWLLGPVWLMGLMVRKLQS